MDADRDRWDQRWSAHGQPAGTIEALAPDVIAAHPDVLDEVPTDGRALDVACGVGAQSLWLAERGLDVVALDVSRVAIDTVTGVAGARDQPIAATLWDSDDGLPTDLTDLAVIVCQRYRATDLYTEFVTRLRPGGVLILTVLSEVGLAGEPGPFHAPAGELTTAFADALRAGSVEMLVDVEADGQASIVLRRIAN